MDEVETIGQTIEIAIAEGVMEEHAVALRERGRSADDVNNWNILAVRTSDGIKCGQLANTKCSDHGGKSIDSCISVRGIT